MERSGINILVTVAANSGENPEGLIEQGFLGNVRQPRVRRS